MEKELIDEILDELSKTFYFKYSICPENETEEEFQERVLEGRGFLTAIMVVKDLINKKKKS